VSTLTAEQTTDKSLTTAFWHFPSNSKRPPLPAAPRRMDRPQFKKSEDPKRREGKPAKALYRSLALSLRATIADADCVIYQSGSRTVSGIHG